MFFKKKFKDWFLPVKSFAGVDFDEKQREQSF